MCDFKTNSKNDNVKKGKVKDFGHTYLAFPIFISTSTSTSSKGKTKTHASIKKVEAEMCKSNCDRNVGRLKILAIIHTLLKDGLFYLLLSDSLDSL